MPSNPADAKGLLKAAIRDDNPVIFIEHRGLYRSKGEVPEGEHLVAMAKSSVVREGTDLTIVALGNMIGAALAAAGELSAAGIEAEVIDPRSLSPLDDETIAKSAQKTGRVIIVHEAVEQGGIGAEIAARIQQKAFYHLDSPVMRVAAPFAPVPAGPTLETQFLPSRQRIVDAARRSLGRNRL
jgi:pyruvate dehydrogenase E1 component beta subunit